MKRKIILLPTFVAIVLVGCQSDENSHAEKSEPPAKPKVEKPAKPPVTNPNRPMKNQPAPEGDNVFIGMDLKSAEEHAKKNDLIHRVVERDGKPLPATRDYRPNRVNFSVKGGKVVKVNRG